MTEPSESQERTNISGATVESMYINLGDRYLAKMGPAADVNTMLEFYNQQQQTNALLFGLGFNEIQPVPSFHVFKSVWQSHGFSRVFECTVLKSFRKSYMEWFYGCVLDNFEKSIPENKAGPIFFLYFLYYTQPYTPPVKVPLTPSILI
jgi:Small nuclear RNA activating complex (SNAPc), subunit 1